jgi:hypothetical protein
MPRATRLTSEEPSIRLRQEKVIFPSPKLPDNSASYYIGTAGSFPVSHIKQGVKVTNYSNPVQRLWMTGAITLLPHMSSMYAVVSLCSLFLHTGFDRRRYPRRCTSDNNGQSAQGRLRNVMAHAQKPDFVLRRNGWVHLNQRGASVQSTTGSRGVRVSGSNAGYTMFRDNVKSTGYPLHSPVSPSLPLPASPCAITFQLDSTNSVATTTGTVYSTFSCPLSRRRGASLSRWWCRVPPATEGPSYLEAISC